MKLLLGILLVFILTMPIRPQEEPKEPKPGVDLKARVAALEREIRSIRMDMEAYHSHEQYRPPEDASELLLRIRQTLLECGCPLK